MAKGCKPHLTPQEAQEVRELWHNRAGKWKASSLARCFNVSASVINAALNRSGAYAVKEEKEKNNGNDA